MMLKTPQTPPEGIQVRHVLVEEASAIDRELYLSMTLDRVRGTHVVMASQAGGMDIEEVAERTPEKILREWTHPALGLPTSRRGAWPSASVSAASQFKQGMALIRNLFPLYLAKDCSLAEINPLVVTKDGRVFALDAKLNFDDNALYRHPEIVALRDIHEEDPLDVEASKYGLNYIKLDGDVGCMVNGAGLAMATMDIVKLAGGEPANFLDVGGGASPEQIENAFRILSSDPSVKAVFINVFGGILRVDRLAEGVIAAVRKLGLTLPVVVRDGGHQRRAGQEDARGVGPAPHHGRRHGRRRAQGRGAGERTKRESAGHGTGREHPRRQVHARGRAGDHRQGGRLPRRPLQGVRHAGGRRRDAGQGRHDPRGLPRVEHGGGGGAEGGRRLRADLRAAAGRRRRHHGGGGRRGAAGRLHHRGHSRRRHGAGQALRARDDEPAHRTELPGRDHAGPGQDRHHAGAHPQGRRRSAWCRAAAR